MAGPAAARPGIRHRGNGGLRVLSLHRAWIRGIPLSVTLAAMRDPSANAATFPVRSGVFGVDRLAKRPMALAAAHEIGGCHLSHWTDGRHTVIKIGFDSAPDDKHARLACANAGTRAHLQL
jgi:hypothetical protein